MDFKKILGDIPVGHLGGGFVFGYASGYFLKQVSKTVAFLCGGAFVLMQGLAYYGIIKIDYIGMEKKVEEALDINKDGKLDAEDAMIVFNKVKAFLSYGLPSAGGFGAGFAAGLRLH